MPVQRAWRDSRLARIGAGADEVMLDYIAKGMGV
jgi:alkylation response protein AidB-like acyl-CoA dehydrogenase